MPRKRKNEDEDDDFTPKKKKLTEGLTISTVSDNEIDWKLLNGYLLWLNVVNPSNEMFSTNLLQPLVQLIQKIKFEDLQNIWFNSKLVFELLKNESSLTISRAVSIEPRQEGIAYEATSLEHFDIETIIEELDSDCLDSDCLDSDCLDSDCLDSDAESEFGSDGQGLIKYVVKQVHIRQCSIEKMIGSSLKESEMYNSLLGLEHTPPISENDYTDGWIINPQWINLCSANKN